jgi:hypothetical protein
MEMKMILKKYRNFIIILIIAMVVGGILGGLSNKTLKIDLTFGENISKFLYVAMLAINLIIIIYLIVTIIYIKSNYKKVDLDNIPKDMNRKVTNSILLCTIQTIIGLTWGAVMITKTLDEGPLYLIMVPTAFIFIAGFLLSTTIKYFNYLNPNRKMNLYENGAEKKYFDKLDDGEKWVTYTCSYTTFNKMQIVYAAALVISMLSSMFIYITIAVPIVIGGIWIIQNLIYSFEAKKYEEE